MPTFGLVELLKNGCPDPSDIEADEASQRSFEPTVKGKTMSNDNKEEGCSVRKATRIDFLIKEDTSLDASFSTPPHDNQQKTARRQHFQCST